MAKRHQLGHGRRQLGRVVATPLVGVAVIALVLASGVGCHGSDGHRAPGGVKRGAHRGGLSAEDRKVVARTALTVMARLATVRAQVRADQVGPAADGLARARDLTQLIAASAPTFNLRERVQIACTHLGFDDPAHVVHELTPIQRELGGLEGVLPIQEAEEHLRRAREALVRDDRQGATRNLLAVADAVVYQEIDLPLKEVDADIVAAQQALQLGRLDEVDGRLGRAESSLDVLTVWARGEDRPPRIGAARSPTQ